MRLTSAEIEILRAIDESESDEGDYTSFARMISRISDSRLSGNHARIEKTLASLQAKTFIEIHADRAVKLTEGGIVARRSL